MPDDSGTAVSRILDRMRAHVDWLTDAYQPGAKSLGVLRMLFAAYVILAPFDYTWVAEVPAAFFNPAPGLPSLMDGPPPMWFLIMLEFTRRMIGVWLAVGWKTTAASVTLTLVLLVGSAIVYSFSKVDHLILFDLAPLAMAATGWGAAYSLDSRRRPGTTRGFPVLLWAITAAFALFTAALPKVVAGWLAPDRHGALLFVATDIVEDNRIGPLGEFLVSLDAGGLWKLLDYATVFAEGWLIVAFLLPGLFRLGVLLLCAFHVGVYLSLGIDFSMYAFVYTVFFCLPFRNWLPELQLVRSEHFRSTGEHVTVSVQRTRGQ